MKNKLFLVLVTAFLQACAVAIPTHQINSPQSLGNNVLEASAFSGSSPSVGPEFKEGVGPSSNSTDNDADDALIFGFRVAYGVTEKIDVELETLTSFFAGGTSILGLKYQWLGQPMYDGKSGDWNSSVRVRYIDASGWEDDPKDSAGSNTIFDNVFIEELDASGYSAALSFGYLVTNWFGVYLGGQAISMDLDYRYREDDANGTLYDGERSLSGYGPFVGFHFNTTGSFFRFAYNMEYSYTNLPATYSNKDVWYEGIIYSTSFFFDFD